MKVIVAVYKYVQRQKLGILSTKNFLVKLKLS